MKYISLPTSLAVGPAAIILASECASSSGRILAWPSNFWIESQHRSLHWVPTHPLIIAGGQKVPEVGDGTACLDQSAL